MLKRTLASLCLAALLAGCGNMPESAAGAPQPLLGKTAETAETASAELVRPRQAVNLNVPLGINFDAQKDYSVQLTFADAIKTSRRWMTNNTLTPVDENGWPMTDFSFQVFVGLPKAEGTYTLTFEGQAQVSGTGAGTVTITNVTTHGNYTRALVNVGPSRHSSGTGQLTLHFRNTNGGVKNIKLMRPGHTNEVFTNQFLDRLKPFTVIRDVHWSQVITTNVTRWEQRPKVTDAQQSSGNGVAYEYLIDLANESGKDLWICIPDQADDEFVRQLGLLLKERLNPDRKVWLELSDEIWNPQYPATGRYLAAAQQEAQTPCPLNSYGQMTDRFALMYRLVARRTIQISDILASVFPGEMLARIRPVMPGQFGDTYHMADALAWAQSQSGLLETKLYGLASAPYFTLTPDDNRRTDLTADEILTKLEARLALVTAMFGTDPNWNGRWDWRNPPTYHTMADFYHLKNVAYEAGPDTMGVESLEAKKSANADPRMALLVERELREWYRQGNGMLVYFDFAAPMNEFGQAGLYQDLSVETPKSQAILRVVNDLVNGLL